MGGGQSHLHLPFLYVMPCKAMLTGFLLCQAAMINPACAHNFPHSIIVHSDIQEVHVCGSSRLVTALKLMFARVQWGSITLLTS